MAVKGIVRGTIRGLQRDCEGTARGLSGDYNCEFSKTMSFVPLQQFTIPSAVTMQITNASPNANNSVERQRT